MYVGVFVDPWEEPGCGHPVQGAGGVLQWMTRGQRLKPGLQQVGDDIMTHNLVLMV